MKTPKSVLITGSRGYIGDLVIKALAKDRRGLETIIAMDVQPTEASERLTGVEYVRGDIRAASVKNIIADHGVDTVVHLVALVTRGHSCDFAHDVEVNGTKNLLEACLAQGVRKLITTSSGAAYGYYADNAAALTEDCPIRGNEEFPYARHKRLIEEMLAKARREHPELEQLVFRPGTVLGTTTQNQITNLFDQRAILGVKGSATPFVFIWDEDVVACILEGICSDRTGIYNMAGDGVMTMREIAQRLGKPYVAVPPTLLTRALRFLKRHGLTEYGPEQMRFLQYRPVLANQALKDAFDHKLQRTTRETFELYCAARGL